MSRTTLLPPLDTFDFPPEEKVAFFYFLGEEGRKEGRIAHSIFGRYTSTWGGGRRVRILDVFLIGRGSDYDTGSLNLGYGTR